MTSKRDLKELQDQRDHRRQDDHLNREREENDLHHKTPKEIQELLEKLQKELAEKDTLLAQKGTQLADNQKVIEQLKSRKIPSTPPHHSSLTSDDSPDTKKVKGNMLVALSGDWKRPFWGDSVNVLKELLLDEERVFQEDKFYAKSMTIIQSSGTGKSRLLDELSKEFLTISFALRHPRKDDGWPPGDHEITHFLTCSTDYKELAARAVALLAAALAQLTEWCNVQPSSTQMKEMAKAFHHEMSPRDPNPVKEHTEFRSNFRIKFIERTVKAAEALYLELINHSAWTDAYSAPHTLAKHELVQKHLTQPARNLTDNLNTRYRESKNPKELLLFVFDEAANLWIGSEGKDGSPFYALRRVLGLLKDVPIWSFLLSTQSTIGSLLPPRELDRSERIRKGGLSTLEPFLALQLNIAASQAVASKVEFDEALRKPMSQFATAEHMTMFGRSLWRAYYAIDPRALRYFVLEKLIHDTTYDCEDANHVFAALASRLCLDVCMESAEAIALAREAVNSYLRILISIDTSQNGKHQSNSNQSKDSDDDHSNISETEDLDRNSSNLKGKSGSGEQHSNSIEGKISVKFNPSTTGRRITSSLPRMVTVTPSEPVVAEAVAGLLCERTNWSRSIYTLAKHLLSKGLVEKGLKGELFARLLCILARDIHLRKASNPADSFPYAKTFSVNDFLQSLFGRKQFQKIKQFTPEVPQTRAFKGSESASFYRVFEKGSMNFTHFTNTDVFLQRENMSDLLHILLRQQLALQLAFGQPTFDILIPIYFGDLDQDFDPARASAVVISVKNRRSASRLPTGPQISEMFPHTKDPILCILMDLGVEKAAINVQGLPKRQSKQYIFAIHAEGAGVETYGYLRGHELQDSTEALLQQTLRPKDPRGVRGNHDELCHRNFLCHYCHSWRHLHPEIKEWEAAERKEKTWDAEAEVAAEVAEEVTEQDVVKRNAEESDAEESVTEEWDGTQWNGL